jgi:hypothetical protein
MQFDPYIAATVGELDCIRKQIPDHLPQTIRVALHQTIAGNEARVKLNAFCVGSGPQRVERRFNDWGEIERMKIEPEIAGDDARNIE